MLSPISWPDFIAAVVTVVAIYYVVTTVIFYRKEIAGLFKHGSPLIRGDHKPSKGEERSPAPMMGSAARREDRMSIPNTNRESSEELNYAYSDELPDPIEESGGSEHDGEHQALVGTISDLLEEIKAVCGAVTDSAASREEATALFKALLSRLQELKDTPYQSSINDHIYSSTREPFLVNFSREEIEAFWNSEA